ncbi:MAG TPA: ABC transporter ATP-binding protein [Burkholderiales bacterium]|jgi:ABC-type branched-subunit amino acid transport system ATPase component|nr:ABC transporter ATP-binding protein [Burkholderiales bacterium]
MIEVENLDAGYGETPVLREVSLRVAANETVAVIGANGAGKSTLVAALCGLIPARAGRIVLAGTDVTRLPAHRRVRHGIGVVLEGRHLFGPMSARQHLTLGRLGARTTREGGKLFELEDVLALFPFMRERLDDRVELMSGGEQQMVALGRALLLQPRLLILDEPSTGLSPLVVKQIMGTIGTLRARGMGILLVEQNVALAAQVADRAYVLSVGRVVHEVQTGEWANFLADDRLVNTYLGG